MEGLAVLTMLDTRDLLLENVPPLPEGLETCRVLKKAFRVF